MRGFWILRKCGHGLTPFSAATFRSATSFVVGPRSHRLCSPLWFERAAIGRTASDSGTTVPSECRYTRQIRRYLPLTNVIVFV